LSLKSILFCGGEVFTLKNYPRLVNKLISQNIFITIITNGTIDRLKSIKNPTNCQLLVSLDGPKEIHDTNRGSGNFDKTIKFIDHALSLNFPIEIMYLVTPESYPYIDSFKIKNLKINYLTQKTYFYTNNHPLSNHQNTKPALTLKQIVNIKQNYPSIPSKNFGCFQLALQSNGQIYGCCESPYALAKISDPIKKIVRNFIDSLSTCQSCKIWSSNVFLGAQSCERSETREHPKKSLPAKVACHGCCAPDFLCGYKQELNLIKCQQVATILNKK
jgi:MoaA/NifB/PqqE/SkfB family radical SAM enzyme